MVRGLRARAFNSDSKSITEAPCAAEDTSEAFARKPSDSGPTIRAGEDIFRSDDPASTGFDNIVPTKTPDV